VPLPPVVASAAEPLSAPAAEAGLTLAGLEQLALANNPTLLQAAMRVQAAEGLACQAGLYPNPVTGYKGDEIGDGGSAGKQGGFVRQEIVTAHKRQLASGVLMQQAQEAQWAWQSQRQRVLNDVRIAFVDLLTSQRIVELNQQLVVIGDEAVKATAQLLRAQEVSRVDELTARVEADMARLRLIDARNRHQSQWRMLAAAVGMPELAVQRLEGQLDAPAAELFWDDVLARLLGGSPELAEARTAIQRARCAVASECAQRIPNVEVMAEVMHHDMTGETMATVELGVPLPIFNRNQGNISRAQAELVSAHQELRRIELGLQQRLATAFERYVNARQSVQQYQATIVPNSKLSLELVENGYRQGEFSYLLLLTAQRTYAQVNLTYLASLRDLHAGVAEIEGLLLTGGLRRPGGENGD